MATDPDPALNAELGAALQSPFDLMRARSVLVKYRDAGVTSEQVYQRLMTLRQPADAEYDDRVLELMDLVTGFCRPDLRVW